MTTETPAADIVERLKRQIPYQGKSVVAFLCHEAAAEITRLRAENAELQSEVRRQKMRGDDHWRNATELAGRVAELQRKLDEAVSGLKRAARRLPGVSMALSEQIDELTALTSIRGEA